MKNYTLLAKVQSARDGRRFYEIKKDEGNHLSCNCPAYIYSSQKKNCKHIKEMVTKNLGLKVRTFAN